MEHKTEASQAVDERPLFEQTMNDMRFFPRELDFTMTKSPSGRDEYANAHLQSCWVGWSARAALKAQPAATDPILARAQSSGGFASFTHYDATMSDDEVIAKFMGKPAPTEAPKGSQIGWVNTKYDIFIPLSGLASTKRNSELLASRELIAVYGEGQLSGNSGELQPSGNTGELAQGWDVDDLISDMDINEEVAGMRAELQASSTIIPSILAAQGEDSARLVGGYIGAVITAQQGRAAKLALLYDTYEQAIEASEFIGELVARASAETGGVK